MNFGTELKQFFRGKILPNELLAKHTSLKVGGVADFYLFPKNETDLSNLINFIQTTKIPCFFIGNGNNLLVSDSGLRGIVIDLSETFNEIKILNNEKMLVEVGAGVILKDFLDFCIENSFGGLEKMSGIPSSVGGAFKMNAGAFGTEISDCTVSVDLMDCFGNTKTYAKNELGFVYRNSKITGSSLVLRGILQFKKAGKTELEKTKAEILEKRASKQPLDYASAGSFFKKVENFDEEVSKVFVEKYGISEVKNGVPAGILIEKCGLKGKMIGKALVSPKHANFIVNSGGAKASDLLALLRLCQKEVKEKFGVLLENEVKLVGFSDAELKG
ncbi:UDP-N-acetylmuramate dehydrogenase [bacterium]|nr:UDP-N-acetylmuramate dehydrogenase [bacterium]